MQASLEIATGPPDTSGDQVVARSQLELFWRRFRRDRVAVVTFGFIVLLVVIAVSAPLLIVLVGAHPPNALNFNALDVNGNPGAPSRAYLFGTDELGRDVFSRTLYGARVSLGVALGATSFTVLIGVTLGMVAGYYRGWVDAALARFFDVLLAFPVLLLALGLAAACSLGGGCLTVDYKATGRWITLGALCLLLIMNLYPLIVGRWGSRRRRIQASRLLVRSLPGIALLTVGLAAALFANGGGPLIEPGFGVVVFVLTLAGAPYMGRLIRGQVLSIREKEYIEAMWALGASDARILTFHVLPNLMAPIVVYATLLIPLNILFEAALSFLGVGVQPPTASWGAMIGEAISVFNVAWWYMTFPGLALLLTVLAFNLLGDAVQDALRPRR